MALFLGGFIFVNLAGALFWANFDQNIWWVDFRPLPRVLGVALLAVAGGLFLWFVFRPEMPSWRMRTTAGVCAVLLAISLWNVIRYYGLAFAGDLRTGFPVPLSLLVSACLLFLGWHIWRGVPADYRPGRGWQRRLAWGCASIGLVIGLAVAFPLAQMYCFGKTDYRRPADVAVVFGAAVWLNGRPSHALTDRVNTGCRLYRDGMVKKLIFSGGPGPQSVHETEAMRRLAVAAGIPEEDILLDPAGINSRATVHNTVSMVRDMGAHRVLAVSHFYHLPRIKMAYGRAGLEVYTVPAKEAHVLLKLPFFLLREVAALWVYYLHPVLDR